MIKETNLQTSFTEALGLIHKAEAPLKVLIGQETTTAVLREPFSKLRRAEPTTVLWGAVSQGKTTLLNALVGTDLGQVGPGRTTSKIELYPVGLHSIYDCPGGDGLPEHDVLVTKAEEKGDVFLCVLGTQGGFERRRVAESVIKLLRQGKGVIVVLNNMSGFEKEDSELHKMKEKVQENLHQASVALDCKGIEKFASIICVDAKLALEGKLLNRSLYLEESGLPELERQIDSLLIHGKGHILSSAMGELEKKLQEILETSQECDPESEAQKQRFQEVSNAKSFIEKYVHSIVEEEVAHAAAKIQNALQKGNEAVQQEVLESTCSSVSEKIRFALDKVNQQLFRPIQNFDVSSISTVAKRLNSDIPSHQEYNGLFAVSSLAMQDAYAICSLMLFRRQASSINRINEKITDIASTVVTPEGSEVTYASTLDSGQFDGSDLAAVDPGFAFDPGDATTNLAVVSHTTSTSAGFLSGLAPWLLGVSVALRWLGQEWNKAEKDRAHFRNLKDYLERFKNGLRIRLEAAGQQAVTTAFQPLIESLQEWGKDIDKREKQRLNAINQLHNIKTAARQILNRAQSVTTSETASRR